MLAQAAAADGQGTVNHHITVSFHRALVQKKNSNEEERTAWI